MIPIYPKPAPLPLALSINVPMSKGVGVMKKYYTARENPKAEPRALSLISL